MAAENGVACDPVHAGLIDLKVAASLCVILDVLAFIGLGDWFDILSDIDTK